MQLSNSPGKLVLPFAASGNKNSIPVDSQIGVTPGAASLADGFPPLTMTPVAAGGVPPSGLDMNGILYEMSAIVRWANAGGGYAYDADFATSDDVAGYPKGARVLRADGLGYWFNTVDNNETDPDAGGAGWVPDFSNGVATVTMASANVTLSATQYGKQILIITGTLTANLNIVFPTLPGEWMLINNTTGGFVIIAKTAAGAGVPLSSGFVGKIIVDGVDLRLETSNFPNIENFGCVPGTDITDALQAAIASGATELYVPNSYYVRTVTVDHNLKLFGPGTFIRPANYDQDNVSAGNATTTMFDVIEHGIRVEFNGLTFDGNEANQNVNTPSSTLIRAYDVVGSETEILLIDVIGCVFKNGTRACVTVKGAIASAGKELCRVAGSTFINGRPGVGAGDPRSVNPSGFAPSYINVNDKFRVQVQQNAFLFVDTLSAVEPLDYAPCAVRFTRVDATLNSQGSGGNVIGNQFYRCGRSDTGYTGTPNSNNGLGVIEAYTIGRDIAIVGNTFDTSLSSCVRAKVSVDQIVVNSNVMRDCAETGVSIGPMAESVGTQTGKIIVNGNTLSGADITGISIVGDESQTPDKVHSIVISANNVSGVTNINASAGGNESAIIVRQATGPIITNNTIRDCADGTGVAGIRLRLCEGGTVSNNRSDGVSSHGVYVQACAGHVTVSNNTLLNNGASGITADQTGTLDVTIAGNTVDVGVNIGINVSTARYASIIGNTSLNLSGSDRGFNVGSGLTFATMMGNVTNATTPLFWTNSGNVSHSGNSWNPSVSYRSAAPTGGTWKVADVVWNSAPVAGGAPGWVCVTAGTPGTWKAMGSLAA